MIVALAWAALRRHPFSVSCSAILAASSASLFGTPVPVALVMWATLSLFGITLWHALEPVILRRLGCRSPSWLERERLDRALGTTRRDGVRLDRTLGDAKVGVVLLDATEPWLGRGLRSLVVSRALLDLLEDRAIQGLLAQAACEVRAASLAGELVVWLGNLPLLSTWILGRWLAQLGRLLALAVGSSLVVPMLLWPAGFIRWAGRLFGAAIVALLGSVLLSSGLAAPGLGLLLAWALVPGLHALLAWESRRAEQCADQATVEAGLGWQLLEALETLAFAESLPPPDGLLGLLCRRGSPLPARADRVWRALSQS
jgi:hypothetical protein